MSKYTSDGWIEFPPLVIGGPTGDYEAICPLTSCEEAEYQILGIATQDNGQPKILISGDNIQPGFNFKYDGSVSMGQRNGIDQGTLAYPGMAFTQNGLGAWNTPVGEYFPVVDSQRRVFVRIDIAVSNSAFITLRYRCRPIRKVVGEVTTVHPDHEHQHNLERERRAIAHLNAETIKGRGKDIIL